MTSRRFQGATNPWILDAPDDLRACTFGEAGQQYVLLSFKVPTRHRPQLTFAERDVLRGVARGCTQAQIAAGRGSSARTVANQIASLFRKFGVSSRLELAREASKLGDRSER